MLSIDQFGTQFSNLTRDWDWEVEGFVDKANRVYPIDLDTKVISTVFERLCSPALRSVAKANKYKVETANQTTYPDFTLTDAAGHRIAIDIKTTYKSNSMVFTLGGYNSFIRNSTKNILYDYKTYSEHWVLGFIYKQRAAFQEYDLDNMPARGVIPCPYQVQTRFLRQKHEICGLRAGSGNTKNIGSVKLSDPEKFKSVQGPFAKFNSGKDACDHYWRNYEAYSPAISTEANLRSHPDFAKFGPK